METRVELRCTEGPKKLLGATVASGQPVKVVDGVLMELPCPYCRDLEGKIRGVKPIRVLHYFSVVGELVYSKPVWPEPPEEGTEDIASSGRYC